jgi:hypothetical protein
MSAKECSCCKQVKPLTEYHVRPGCRDGYAGQCKACRCEVERVRRQSKPGYMREKSLNRFSLTTDLYEMILELQGNGCAICGRETDQTGWRMPVDHDHSCCSRKDQSCGKCLRGILCSNCNHGLGHFGDDPELLRRAIIYLNRKLSPASHIGEIAYWYREVAPEVLSIVASGGEEE